MDTVAILSFALRRWWEELISVILLCTLWLAAQVLIVPGPPATAMLWAMARRTYDGEYWGVSEAWAAFKELFGRAWLWALPNLIIVGIALYNLSVFWRVPGVTWGGLRIVWLLVLFVWLGLNLFFWPFYLAAEDHSLRNTYANCARFWLLHVVEAFLLFVVCLAIGAVTLPFALPIVLGVPFWIALVSETTVRRSLETMREGQQLDQ